MRRFVGLAFAAILMVACDGAGSAEELIEQYISAARSGNTSVVRSLMPRELQANAQLDSRIAVYRTVARGDLKTDYRKHPEASYLIIVTITSPAFTDVVSAQLIGRRWYFVPTALTAR